MRNDEAKKILLSKDRVDLLHQLITSIVQEWKDAGLFRSCLNCSYWSEPPNNHGCGKFQQMPPPKIIVTGCNDHSDLIPF